MLPLLQQSHKFIVERTQYAQQSCAPVGGHGVKHQVTVAALRKISTRLVSNLNSCGMRTAWLLPFINTLLTAVCM
jgi:hypothetical protein